MSAHQDISIRIEIHGTYQNQKIGSALASLGVFASPRVANPRKGRLRDAEAAEGKSRNEATDAEGIWLHRRVARTPQGPQGAGRMEADYE